MLPLLLNSYIKKFTCTFTHHALKCVRRKKFAIKRSRRKRHSNVARFLVYHGDHTRKQLRHVRDTERRKASSSRLDSPFSVTWAPSNRSCPKKTPGFPSSPKGAVACDLGGAMRLGTEQGSRWRKFLFPASLPSFFSVSF